MPQKLDSPLRTVEAVEGPLVSARDHFTLVVLGTSKVGKTTIVQQFLYGSAPEKYTPTIEEFHQGEMEFDGTSVTLDIIDTSGAMEFPAQQQLNMQKGTHACTFLLTARMFRSRVLRNLVLPKVSDGCLFLSRFVLRSEENVQLCNLKTTNQHITDLSADAFLLVFSYNNRDSFEQIGQLRESILRLNRKDPKMVVVGNKGDLLEDSPERCVVTRELAESLAVLDWEVGFVHCWARENRCVVEIFNRLLSLCGVPYELPEKPKKSKQRKGSLPTFVASPSDPKIAGRRHNSCNVS
ncbi:GTP-binding protein Rhes-like [Tropilaelaps mercedesae]|uniref:GTP-binding protein Rhes-like n=1 Tax=Tropilaelaps mercedesae TaxID=418985 RepID=A0A1V9XKZ3_9ACAR|nr:GTP-binding protein Rhes-like [Tropilaelaps mercedesae]